nr:hypothetical protein L484_003249 [Ipomoea trifida]
MTVLSPKTICDWKSRSTVEAATVKIQGASLTTVLRRGPEFPAEQTTTMPLSTAWNAPMATTSVEKSGLRPPPGPSDSDNTSTPSLIPSSKAFKIADPEHPKYSQTRYMAIREVGDPPLAVPLAWPWYDASSTSDPAAVDATWVPCPSLSLADGICKESG